MPQGADDSKHQGPQELCPAQRPPRIGNVQCCFIWYIQVPPLVLPHPREDGPLPPPGGRLPSDAPPPTPLGEGQGVGQDKGGGGLQCRRQQSITLAFCCCNVLLYSGGGYSRCSPCDTNGQGAKPRLCHPVPAFIVVKLFGWTQRASLAFIGGPPPPRW